MFGRVALRGTHSCIHGTNMKVSQSVARLRPMSTKRLQDAVKYLEATDLIETGRIRHPHLNPEAFSERLRGREPELEAFGAPEESREELVSRQTRFRRPTKQSKQWSAESRRQWIEQTPKTAPELRDVAAEEEAFLADAASFHSRSTRRMRKPAKDIEGAEAVAEARPRKFRTPRPAQVNAGNLSDPVALAAKAQSANQAVQRSGGRRRRRRQGVNLFGENEGKDDKESLMQGEEDLGDLDPDTIRMFRQMNAWRNPVVAEEEGKPALFHHVKTGYDLYAEARTEFRLNDHTTTVTVNSPTAPLSNSIGGPEGEYKFFLPEHIQGLAGQDSSSLPPEDIVRLALVQSADLSPMHKEALAATVREFITKTTTNKARA